MTRRRTTLWTVRARRPRRWWRMWGGGVTPHLPPPPASSNASDDESAGGSSEEGGGAEGGGGPTYTLVSPSADWNNLTTVRLCVSVCLCEGGGVRGTSRRCERLQGECRCRVAHSHARPPAPPRRSPAACAPCLSSACRAASSPPRRAPTTPSGSSSRPARLLLLRLLRLLSLRLVRLVADYLSTRQTTTVQQNLRVEEHWLTVVHNTSNACLGTCSSQLIPNDIASNKMSRLGGFGDLKAFDAAADAELGALFSSPAVLAQLSEKLGKRVDAFEIKSFATQVVAGLNYKIVGVVNGTEQVAIEAFKSLPHAGGELGRPCVESCLGRPIASPSIGNVEIKTAVASE